MGTRLQFWRADNASEWEQALDALSAKDRRGFLRAVADDALRDNPAGEEDLVELENWLRVCNRSEWLEELRIVSDECRSHLAMMEKSKAEFEKAAAWFAPIAAAVEDMLLRMPPKGEA